MLIVNHLIGFGAGAASSPPVVAGTNASSTNSGTSLACALPAGIAAGDLLVLFVGASRGDGTAVTISTPSGWTSLFNVAGTGQVKRLACFYKVATGSEGGTQTVSFSAGSQAASTCARVTGYGGAPESGAAATGSSSAPNPPSVAPSWGGASSLFLAATACAGTGTNAQTAPANYSDIVQASGIAGGNDICRVASAQRIGSSASEDPGAFGVSFTSWVANSVAIRPA
jgi:hypothetical protein